MHDNVLKVTECRDSERNFFGPETTFYFLKHENLMKDSGSYLWQAVGSKFLGIDCRNGFMFSSPKIGFSERSGMP